MKPNHKMDLIPSARSFDLKALETIYDQHNQGLYAYAYHLLGNAMLAEECVAEIFSRFLKALQGGKGPNSNLKGYLYRSAHNWVTDYYRTRRDESELDDEMPGSEHPEVGTEVERRFEQHRLRSALSQLPREQYQVVAMHFVEGWELNKVAEVLGKSVGSVKSLQHRALHNLRKQLIGQETEHENTKE